MFKVSNLGPIGKNPFSDVSTQDLGGVNFTQVICIILNRTQEINLNFSHVNQPWGILMSVIDLILCVVCLFVCDGMIRCTHNEAILLGSYRQRSHEYIVVSYMNWREKEKEVCYRKVRAKEGSAVARSELEGCKRDTLYATVIVSHFPFV